jgi:predicted ATPase/predicted negative regulator of RcsB-dependent stress response
MKNQQTNLDADPTSFVGRSTEMAELGTRVDEERLVTIVGAGGAGKTRLSREYARQVERFDEVWFCELTGAEDAESCAFAVAESLGMDLTHTASANIVIEQLGGELASRGDILLILDNAEQAIDGTAELIANWLEAATNVTFLVTSRQPLRLKAESQYNLGALPTSGALQLFEERAGRVRKGFRVDDTCRETVTTLVERLGAMPLAIELAACRLNVLSPSVLLEQLESSLSVLKRRSRDGVSRHRTMDATIQWSWDLLEPLEQRLLAEATVFAGSFSIQAAEKVLLTDLDEPVLEFLEALVDKSLLHMSSAPHQLPRFDMFEPIRQFARSRLSAQDRRRVEAAHARFFIDVADGGRKVRVASAADNLERAFRACREHHPELSVHAAMAHYRLMRRRGLFRRILGLVDQALSLAVDDPSTRAQLLGARAICRLNLGRHRLGLADVNTGREAAQLGDDDETCAFLEATAASLYRAMGRPSDAREPLERARQLVEPLDKPLLGAMIRGNLGLVNFDTGHFSKATEILRAVCDLARDRDRDRGSARLRVYALHRLARVELERRRLEHAELVLQEARDNLDTSDRLLRLEHTALQGHLALAMGHHDDARAHFEAGLDDDRIVGAQYPHIPLLFGASLVAGDAADERSAENYLSQVLDILEETDDSFALVQTHVRLGTIKLRSQDFDSARWHLSSAIGHSPGLEDARVAGLAHGLLAVAFAGLDDADRAAELMDEARRRLESAEFGESFVADLDSISDLIDICLGHEPPAPDALAALRQRLRDSSEAGGDEPTARIWLWSGFDHRLELLHVVDATVARLDDAHPERGLRVARDGSLLAAPGEEAVDLSQRELLGRLVARLAELRDQNPGQGISVDEMLKVGWPDEVLTADSGASRVYTAVRTLRSMGLEEIIKTGDDGYFFDPRVALHWFDN